MEFSLDSVIKTSDKEAVKKMVSGSCESLLGKGYFELEPFIMDRLKSWVEEIPNYKI